MRSILNLIFIAVILFSGLLYSQTKSFGNYEVYSRETSSSAVGFLSTNLKVVDSVNTYNLTQKGIMYLNQYSMGEIANFALADNQQIRISTEGVFKIGFAAGTNQLSSIGPAFDELNVKYYVGSIDFFSLDIMAEYTYVLEQGYAVTARYGMGLVNVGGSLAFKDKGTFKENAIAMINLIPFTIKPSVYFDFGRGGFGLGFYINPYNILSYRFAPKELYNGDNKGIQFSDSTIKNFAFEVFFSF